ncbi:hypothetical protein T231_02840 [Tannerella sp. oral taxon BU063 isolate Cell 6/7/9]|uniref:Uncharacterized protein n=1 Tax=Tannerella sp. oral taxon BU063 isolate Cell 6/7/9 TaxID=1411021 RepID=W2CUT0_9BACT|nr:hypothetical protein T231_02840 [Tannerella sp. oral taxon BU063 isolate Cell 6/7/9]
MLQDTQLCEKTSKTMEKHMRRINESLKKGAKVTSDY